MSNPNDPRYREEQLQRELEEQRLRQRDKESTSRGVLIGVLATGLVCLGVVVWLLVSQRKEPDVVPIPNAQDSPTPSPTPPEINIDITEPTAEPPPPPEVNTDITVPPSPPPAPSSPEPAATPSPEPPPEATPEPPASEASPEPSPAE